MRRIPRWRLAATLIGAALIVLAASLASSSRAAPPRATTLPALQGPAITNSLPGGCDVFFTEFGITCYGPYELAKAYDFPSNLDGSGQTIIIVDAYGSGHIASDLHLFDANFGVPDPGPGKLVIQNGPPSVGTGSGDLFGWGIETSLDVEYAHAMAPAARIVLAVASSDDDTDLNNAEAAILPQYPGAVVSHSYGDWETDPGAGQAAAAAHKIYLNATNLGDTLVASSGDAGATFTQYTGTTSPALAGYPASDPLVTGVGGTMGNPYDFGLFQNGGYGGEQTWNESPYGYDAAGGGAPSVLFNAPTWQVPVIGRYKVRTVPDVSYNASIQGGVGVVFTTPPGYSPPEPAGTNLWLVGGTSAGSPQWAAIFALVNQARAQQHLGPLGFANGALYSIARNPRTANAFHDITIGSNALDSPIGFSAAPGYDLATGLGTPDVAKLVPPLVAAPGAANVGAVAPVLNAPAVTPHGRIHHLPHTAVPG